jgi:uncharacterized protein (TIGR03437 family)
MPSGPFFDRATGLGKNKQGWMGQVPQSYLRLTLLLLSGLAAPGNAFGQAVPRILTNGIVNAAGAPLAPVPVAPGGIISIYGANFNSSPGTHAGGVSATPPLPASVGGTQVLINSRFAPLYYVDSTQINAQVPWEVSGATYLSVQVIVNGLPSNLSTVPLAANAPGLLVVSHALDGSLVSSSQPATPGEYLTIYVVGLGPVANPPATGAAALAKPLSTTTLNPNLTIGGVAASVIFSGLTPGFSGLYQVNARVPEGIPNGDDIAVVLSVGGAVSNTITTSVESGAPSNVQVTVSPTSASLVTGATQQFTAAVTGTANSSVTWTVNGVPGGNLSVGTISAAGLYTAPATTPSGNLVFLAATSAAASTVAGTATVSVSAPPAVASPLGRVRSAAPGLYTQFEERGWSSGYYPGQVIQTFTQIDSAGNHVSQEVALQLDKMKAMGLNSLTYEFRSSNDPTDVLPYVPPTCGIGAVLGLNWPQPTAVELTNLKAFFDLVQSKGMRVRVHLVNMHMEEQPPTNSTTWVGAILEVIGKHPALDVVMFDGDTFIDGGACGIEAEPPLWLGPGTIQAQYIQWAIGFAQSLGIAPSKLSAEAIVGDYYTQNQGPAGPNATNNHLWNPVGVLKGIFDQLNIPENQRVYALSFYEHNKCISARNLPCSELDPHSWAEQTLQTAYGIIGTGNGARVVATEMGDAAPVDPARKTEWTMESLVTLLEKYPIEGGSFYRWTSYTNCSSGCPNEDADPTLADPVKRRGVNFVYNPVQKEILDWGGFHLTYIPNSSFEDDLDSNGVPTHWAMAGKGSASAYYLPQESHQPQVPSRGSYCLRLTARDITAAISATSDRIAVTPGTAYTTAANLRFAWSGDLSPSGSASTRPQVFVTIHYLNANGQPASVPSTVFSYFQENSTQGFQAFVFQYTTPSDARAVQIEVGAARNGLAAPVTVDVDNLR